ncbi:hypothetical protein Ahy_A05g022317 isoform F [Arachis hypogaea]|uniref:Uncharacterized protein n=1 Tax=Arachis hypogaea TaxID=3818 RepID=A0A445D075_ARAHY|nr:hypothetical protein Ahy_A05g022317 isoform F [Arachis hypogaea]
MTMLLWEWLKRLTMRTAVVSSYPITRMDNIEVHSITSSVIVTEQNSNNRIVSPSHHCNK